MTEDVLPEPVPLSAWARFRNRVISYSATPYATVALAVVAFIDGSVFPIPPFALLAPMVLAHPKRAWRYILIGTGASLLGGLVGYAIGHGIASGATTLFHIDPALPVKIARFNIDTTLRDVLTTNFWLLAVACSILPTPYKVVAIASGFVGVALPQFFLASVLGRFARFIGFTYGMVVVRMLAKLVTSTNRDA